MAGSKIILTFSSVGVSNNAITLDGNAMTFTFKETRRLKGQVGIANSVAQQVLNFYNAFQIDYNAKGVYNVSYDNTTLTIESFTDDLFTDFDNSTNTTSITAVDSTIASKSSITTTVTFDEALTNQCNKVIANIVFSSAVANVYVRELYSNTFTIPVIEQYNETGLNVTQLSVEINRGQYLLEVFASNSANDVTTFFYGAPPDRLSILSIDSDTNEFGGFIGVNINDFVGSNETEYAIISSNILAPSNSDYQSSQYFGQLAPETYRVFVKDVYGCVKVQTIEISGLNNIPLIRRRLTISSKNSIPFFSRTLPTNALNANNYNFNYLEAPYNVQISNYSVIYANSQKTKIQFKSSYGEHRVDLRNCDGILQTLPINQKTNNIRRFSYLEGQLSYNSDLQKLAISFSPGDTYDEEGNVVGSHTYNGVLPSFYEIGTTLLLLGFNARIVDIVVINGIEYAITSLDVNTTSNSAIIETVHQALPYEVFEFELNFSEIIYNDFYVTVSAFRQPASTLQDVADKVWTSPLVSIIESEKYSQLKYHECYYWSDADDDEIDYSTGIFHLRNIPYYNPLKPLSVGNVETEKLGSLFVKLDGESNSIFESDFEIVPTMYAQSKVKLFDTSDYIVIDNMLCTTFSNAEIEHKGQYSIVKVQIGVNDIDIVRSNNQFRNKDIIDIISSDGYYPVKP